MTEREALERMRAAMPVDDKDGGRNRENETARIVIVSTIRELRYLARELGATEEQIRNAVRRAEERGG